MECDLCQNLNQEEDISYQFNEEQRYLIVRLNNQVYDQTLKKSKRIKTIIKPFDSEKTVFPGEKIEFRLISCVQHLSDNDKSGHFVCWVKRNKNWLVISDENFEMMQNLISDLQDVYYLVFEKI